MKTISLRITALLLICSMQLKAQDFSSVRKYLDDADKTVRDDQNYLLTSQGLNKYFATRVAYYLSSSGDLSLFKNYAILTPSDNNLFVGHNFARKDNDNFRIKDFLTLGLNANYANSIAPIFSGKKFQGGLSLSLKYTTFFRGSINFGDKNFTFKQSQIKALSMGAKDSMNIARQFIIGSIKKTIEDDSTALEQSLTFTHFIKPAEKSAIRKKKYAELSNAYKEAFAKQEADVLKVSPMTKASHFSWLSINLNIPFTPTTYSNSETFSTVFDDRSSYPYSLNLTYNNVWENGAGRFFLMIKPGIIKNNSVLAKQLSKLSYGEYKNLGGADTAKSIQLSTTDVYIGKYSAFITPSMKFQAIYFPKFSDQVGLDLQLEKNAGTYHPINGVIGIPFRLTGSDPDKAITFEVQLQMPDLRKEIAPDKKFWDKAIIGVTVGLPFGSSIY